MTPRKKRESVADVQSTSTRITKSDVMGIVETFEKIARALHALVSVDGHKSIKFDSEEERDKALVEIRNQLHWH